MMFSEVKRDIVSSIKNWRFWVRFAWQDIINANIRTRLGVVFYPLLAGIWIVTIALLFGDLLGEGKKEFMAYVGIGYVSFTFMSGCITASYSVFSRNMKIIQNMPIGILNFPLRETTRYAFQFLLQSLTVVAVVIFTSIPINVESLIWLLPAFVILITFGLTLTLFFAIVGTYLPDLAALAGSVMRILFFVTPIWWYPGDRGGMRAMVADFNPLTHFIRLFRYPILEQSAPPPLTWMIVAGTFAVFLILSLSLFAITRRHILLRL